MLVTRNLKEMPAGDSMVPASKASIRHGARGRSRSVTYGWGFRNSSPTGPYFSGPSWCRNTVHQWRRSIVAVTGAWKTHVTLPVTVRVTPGVPRSCWEHSGCAWRDDQFGRGQNTGMGWSDPTSLPREPWRSLQPSEQDDSQFTGCFARVL